MMKIDEKVVKNDLEYLLICVEVHADKFPVPSHMLSMVKRIRNAVHEGQINETK